MKRKNAFTLIELIATIAIIAIVSLAATITYNKIRVDILEHQYLNLKTLIETAAVKYSNQNGYFSFFVKDLIDAGLVEPDDETDVYDPRNNKSLNCHVLYVTEEDNGTLSAKLSDKDYSSDGACDASSLDQYEANLGITKYIEGSQREYYATKNDSPYIINGWTRYNLDLTAVPNNVNAHAAKYVWNKNTDNTFTDPVRTFTTNEYGVYNDYYYLDMYTEDNTRYTAKFMYKFDNEKPTIYKDSIKCITPDCNTEWSRSKTILFRATDRNGSGIKRVYVGYKTCDEVYESGIGNAPTPGLVQIYEVAENTGATAKALNVCVIDTAGNMATDTFDVKLDDPRSPLCARIEPLIADGDWTNQTRTIRVYCSDTQTEIYNGHEISVTGIGCEHEYYDKTYESSTTRGSTVISDKLGNTTTCSYNVLVDKTAPWCPTAQGETTTWTQGPVTITQECRDDHSGCASGTQSITYTTSTKQGDIPIVDNVANSNVCHPNVYVDVDPPYISYASSPDGTSFTESRCPGGISYTWTDDHSGFAGGSIDIYYKAPGASDFGLVVAGLGNDANPVPGFWYKPSSDPEYQYYTCAAGTYKFVLRGTDNVGNTSSDKVYTYTVSEDPAEPSYPSSPTVNYNTNTGGSGCSGRVEEITADYNTCTNKGLNYLAIYNDSMRCPYYGCKTTGEWGEQFSYTITKNKLPLSSGAIENSLPWETGNDQYNYMQLMGTSGPLFYYIKCSGTYTGTSMPSSCSNSSTPYQYRKKSCSSVTLDKSSGKYKVTCTYEKRACLEYKNGTEYWPNTSSEYQYMCLNPGRS